MNYIPYLIFLALFGTACSSEKAPPKPKLKKVFTSARATFVIDTLAQDLKNPGGIDWLNDNTLIFSERGDSATNLNLLDLPSMEVTPICNLPAVHRAGDGGMLEVLVHPQYPSVAYVYFAYSKLFDDSTSTLVVDRAKVINNCLEDRETVFEVFPRFKSNAHFGCRMALQEGYLFITMGERYSEMDSAQTLSNHFGKVIRLHEDGRIPEDNPFVAVRGAKKEVWSYGHRNPQGLAIHPGTGELWEHEHGPQGGDEVNIIQAGLNYGWPVITYGEEYGGGPIGEGITALDGMEQPLYYYVPSIAPSGMTFYSGKAFPEWQGSLFIGAMAKRHLNRLEISEGQPINEERLLESQNWRVRIVQEGPDGFLYLGVDDGMLLRLRPD